MSETFGSAGPASVSIKKAHESVSSAVTPSMSAATPFASSVRPIFFALHVPKCAGRTIEHHMRRHLGPLGFWSTRRPSKYLPRLFGPAYKRPSNDVQQNVRVVSGHHVGASAERLFPDQPIKKMVLLRDPVSFHLSYYNFRSMRYRRMGLGHYSFNTHLRSQPDDPITHFLLSTWLEKSWPELLFMSAERKYELLNQALSRFWFVGDYQFCDEICRKMSSELGISTEIKRANTKEQWQEQTSWQPLSKDDLTSEQIDHIEQRTVIDRMLWQTWREAKYDTASIRPRPLPAIAGARFATRELTRPYHAATRQILRRLRGDGV